MIRPLHVLAPAAVVAAAAATIGMFTISEPVTYEAPVVEVAATPMISVAEFPRHYVGTFLWDGESALYTQHLVMDLHEVDLQGDLIVATGRGTYTAQSRKIDFSVRVEADPVSGEWTMWESNPSVQSGFVTNGRHVATFDGPFENLTARWIGDDGLRGNLQLTVAPTSQRVKQQRNCAQKRAEMRQQQARMMQQRAQIIQRSQPVHVDQVQRVVTPNSKTVVTVW